MIEKSRLRELVIETLERNPRTQVNSIQNDVERIVKERDLFPTREECEAKGIDYRDYSSKTISKAGKAIIAEIIWDLIMERVLTPGDEQSNYGFPLVSLTTFGEAYIKEAKPHYYDADQYINLVKEVAPNLNPVILQYIHEGISCYRRLLLFASAVMFGAAAEIAVLSLLESIKNANEDAGAKAQLSKMMEGARLPTIFEKITDTLAALTRDNTIPYPVHQGCSEHLISLFEMIRVQRNDAVHPVAGEVNRDKVFLTMQTFPTLGFSAYIS